MKKILQLLSLKASFVSGLFNDFKAKPWRYLPWTIGFGLLIFIPIDLVFAQESILQNSFFSILNSVLFTIVTVLGKLLVIIIDLMLRIVSYNNFVHEGFVIKGWIVLRDVLNTLFIFFLLMIAFATIFNYESYGYKSLLGKVLLAAILVNFSRTIAGIAIDFSHVFMMVFLNGFKDAAAGNFTKGLGIRDIVQFGTTDPGDISGKEIFGSLVFGIIYLLIAVVTILVYFLMFVLRIIALWFLVITSPVYFVLNAVPFGKQSASQWLKNFSKYLVIGPALAFFLWLSLAAMGTVSQTFHSNLSETGTETSAQLEAGNDQLSAAISKSARPAGLMSYVISIGLLWGSLIYASKSGVAGSQVAGKAMEKMKKFGSSTAKKAGLAPFKHVGGRIARSEGLKKAFDKVGGRGGKLGTALMLTGIRPAAEKLGLKMQENKDKYKKEAEKKVKALSGADMHASLRRRGQQKGGALSPFRVPSMAVRDEIHKKHPEYLNPRDAAKWVSKNRKAKDYNDAGAEAMFVVSEGIKKQRVLSTDPEEIRELQTAENQMGQTAEGTGMRTDVLASLNLDKNRNPIPQLGQLSRFTTVWGAAKARKAQGYSTATEEEQRDLAGGKHYTAVGADAPADDKQFAAGDEPASGDEEKVTSDTDDSDEKEAETTELRDRLDETQYGEKARKRRVPQKKVDNTVAAIKRHDQGIFVDKLAIAESLGYTSSKAAGTAAAQYQQDLDQKGPSEILRRVEGKNIKIRASNKKKKKRDREELLKPGDYMLPSFYESKAFEDDLALPITDRKYVEYDQLRAPTSRHRMTGINKMLRASGEGKQLQSALIAADFAQLGLGEKPAYHTSDKEAMAEAQTAVLRQMAGEGYDRAEMEAVQKQFEGMSSIQMLNKANSVFQDKDRTPVAKIDDEKYEEELDEDGRKIRKKGEDGKPLPFDRYETYTTQEDENRTTSVGFKNTKHVIAEEDMHRRIESLDDGAEEELWDTVKDEDKESIRQEVYKHWNIAPEEQTVKERSGEMSEAEKTVMNEFLTNAFVNRHPSFDASSTMPSLKIEDNDPILEKINSDGRYAPIKELFGAFQSDGIGGREGTSESAVGGMVINNAFTQQAAGEAIATDYAAGQVPPAPVSPIQSPVQPQQPQVISQATPPQAQAGDDGGGDAIVDALEGIADGVGDVKEGIAETTEAVEVGAQATERGVGAVAQGMKAADTAGQTQEASRLARERRDQREDRAAAEGRTKQTTEGLADVSEEISKGQEKSKTEESSPSPSSEPSIPQPPPEE